MAWAGSGPSGGPCPPGMTLAFPGGRPPRAPPAEPRDAPPPPHPFPRRCSEAEGKLRFKEEVRAGPQLLRSRGDLESSCG